VNTYEQRKLLANSGGGWGDKLQKQSSQRASEQGRAECMNTTSVVKPVNWVGEAEVKDNWPVQGKLVTNFYCSMHLPELRDGSFLCLNY